MQADPSAQRALLQIAELDAKVAQLRHRQTNLPENADLHRMSGQRATLSEQLVASQTRLGDAQAEQERIESDLTPARARAERNQRTIDAGAADPKALQSMIAETDHLAGRIAKLEDAVLEAMQVVEDETATHDSLVAQRTAIENQMRQLLATRDSARADLAVQIEGLESQRAELAGRLPADVVARYDKVASRQGTGAAELRARRCGGCGLELDTTELKRIAAASPSEVITCDECGRILVRTNESGV